MKKPPIEPLATAPERARPSRAHSEVRPLALPELRTARWGACAVIVTALALVATVLSELLGVAHPAPVRPEPPVVPRLASHLVVLLVDGLRYDVGTDPTRAPHFARHMREDAHAEVWAGRVTMTSAAVLTMGTGQRGDFAHIVLNLGGRRTPFDDLKTRAHAAGLRTALAGDDTWVAAFGDFDRQVLSDPTLALQIDDSPRIFDAARQLALAEPRPDWLVVHWFAPDHQMHVHGVDSEAYRAFLRAFDARLQAFLDELPPDTTVVALSDHGGLDNGNHGVDSDLERRTPLFAYGPGIRPGAVDAGRQDQVDLAATFAVLLGVPGPAQGRGTAIGALLDLDEARAADLACADARRIARVADAEHSRRFAKVAKPALAACASGAPDRARLSRDAVRGWDQQVERSKVAAGTRGLALSMSLLIAVLVTAGAVLVPRASARGAAQFLGAGLLAVLPSVALTWLVDHSVRPWTSSRGLFVWLTTAATFLAALFPRRAAILARRAPAIALGLVPGALACAFPTNAQLHAFLVVASVGAAWMLAVDAPSRAHVSSAWGLLGGRSVQLAFGLVAVALLASSEQDPIGAVMHGRAELFRPLGAAVTFTWLALGARARDGSFRPLAVLTGLVAAAAPLVVSQHVPASVGLAALLGFPALALVAFRARQRTVAFGLAFGAYAWLARDVEVLGVAGVMMIAEPLGLLAARRVEANERAPEHRIVDLAVLGAVLVALVYLCRVSLQRGLDFRGLDWTAGTFGGSNAPPLRVALAIGWKHVLAELLAVGAVLAPLPRAWRASAVALLALAMIGRSSAMALTLFTSVGSYWSAFTTFSDLPTALAHAALAGVLWFTLAGRVPHDAPAAQVAVDVEAAAG